MSNPLTLPIARLRASGCRVSTVIGHDPAIGDWIYAVTPPAAFTVGHLARAVTAVTPDVRVYVTRDGERLIVSATLYRIGQPLAAKADRDRVAGLLAATLHALADKIGA